MAFCQGCGTPIQQTDTVCPNCGMAIANQPQGTSADKSIIVNVQQPAVPAPPGKGMSIASLVLGIIALIDTPLVIVTLGCMSLFVIPVAIVGLILGIIGKKKLKAAGAPFGMATAGIVMSTISLAITLILLVIALLGFLGLASAGSLSRYRF